MRHGGIGHLSDRFDGSKNDERAPRGRFYAASRPAPPPSARLKNGLRFHFAWWPRQAPINSPRSRDLPINSIRTTRDMGISVISAIGLTGAKRRGRTLRGPFLGRVAARAAALAALKKRPKSPGFPCFPWSPVKMRWILIVPCFPSSSY